MLIGDVAIGGRAGALAGSATARAAARAARRSGLPRGGDRCKPVCKPDSVLTSGWGTAIHLGCRLPGASCGLTRDTGRAAPGRRGVRPCSTLLRTGFTWPVGHPTAGGLLPHHFTVATTGVAAVSFLWHSPSGHPDWVLPSALLVESGLSSGGVPPAAVRPACRSSVPPSRVWSGRPSSGGGVRIHDPHPCLQVPGSQPREQPGASARLGRGDRSIRVPIARCVHPF